MTIIKYLDFFLFFLAITWIVFFSNELSDFLETLNKYSIPFKQKLSLLYSVLHNNIYFQILSVIIILTIGVRFIISHLLQTIQRF